MENSATSQVTNTTDIFRGKDSVLMVVSKATSLFEESGRKTVRVGLVVDQLGVNVVVDVPGILQSRGAAKHEITNSTKEGLRTLFSSLELGGRVYVRGVLLESRAVSPGLKGAVVSRFDSFDRDVLVAAERSDDRAFIGKNDLVVWVGREKTLEKGNGGVKDHGTFTASLGVDVDLVSVDKVSLHAGDIRRR